jgi:hypothetical protein
MRHHVAEGTTLAALLLALALVPRDAHAYLDAGTGSYIIQLAIAGFVGGLFAIKLFWKKIGAFLKRVFSRTAQDEQPKE